MGTSSVGLGALGRLRRREALCTDETLRREEWALGLRDNKLAVGLSFLPPATYGPYWVVFAGPDEDNYEYGIVSGGAPKIPGASGAGCIAGTEDDTNGSGLWLFTKDAIPKPETVKMLKDKASELGFDASVLQPVEHEGCTYDE